MLGKKQWQGEMRTQWKGTVSVESWKEIWFYWFLSSMVWEKKRGMRCHRKVEAGEAGNPIWKPLWMKL